MGHTAGNYTFCKVGNQNNSFTVKETGIKTQGLQTLSLSKVYWYHNDWHLGGPASGGVADTTRRWLTHSLSLEVTSEVDLTSAADLNY